MDYHPRLLLLLAMIALLGTPLRAQEATDANLITAIDVSGSIKPADERLEFEGMAAAVADPRFLQAIARGRHGRIGFVAFTWANGEFVSAGALDADRLEGRRRPGGGAPARRARHAGPGLRHARPGACGPTDRGGPASDRRLGRDRARDRGRRRSPFASHHNVINMCANGIDNVGGRAGRGARSAPTQAG